MLNRHLSGDLWLGMFCGSKTSQHNIDFDCKEHTIGTGVEYNTKWVFPVVAPPLSHFQQLKRIYDAFDNQLWCISSKTLGLHVWRKHQPHDSGRVHNAVKTSLHKIGLGHVEVHPMSGRCQRLPFGKDYITIVPDTVLHLWQDQALYFEREEWETPSFDHIVRTIWGVADIVHRTAWSVPMTSIETGFKGVFEQRRQEVMAWVDRGYKDVAVNIPAELVANETHAASQQGDRGRLELRVPLSTAEAITAVAAEYSGNSSNRLDSERSDRIDVSLGVAGVPDKRNREWAFWCEHVAATGLHAHDSVGEVVRELAAWLLWIELFDRKDKMQQTVELLTMFLEHKHNGFITRGVDHPDVRKQVVRCIKTANKQDARSKQEFCIVRQKRQQGRYRRNIMIEGLLMHADMGSEALPQSLSSFDYKCRNKDYPLPPKMHAGMGSEALPQSLSSFDYKCRNKDCPLPHEMHAGMGSEALPQSLSSFDYKCINKDCPLPPEIESKITQIITSERMRKRAGEYPLLRLGRRFFNALWDRRGSGRIPRDMWHAMLGYENPKQELKYKKLFVQAGLLQPGWERTIRRGAASSLYKMTAECKRLFEEHHQRQAATA